ncbi:MAG: hypothetical protein JWL85_319 [Candidatus Saccharibacteria bacterium]|nr:hypothetical protein [Candidatus Saccharibacteria bacterium]
MAKKTTTSPKPKAPKQPRKLASPEYKTFRLQKRIKTTKAKLPGAFTLFKRSIRHLWQHKKLFGGIVLFYLLLTVLLVKGFSQGMDVRQAKETVVGLLGGGQAELSASFTVFSYLVGGANATSSDASSSVYQSILIIVTSLALIWALRQTYAGIKVRVKDAFYKGMYPLVPFSLVLLVIGLQMIPMVFGGFLYTTVFGNGLAVTGIEQLLWGTLILMLVLLSVYMVCSSIFALYVVTLPDLTPMKALRTTRELVRYRRWSIVRKVLFLPAALLILGALIMVPVIFFVPVIAEWLFFAISMFAVVITHGYMYSLYRELI